MNRTRMMMKAFLLASLLLTFRSSVDAQDASYPVVSDKSWTVHQVVKDKNGNNIQGSVLGNAQQVCISPTSPATCPPGALMYDPTGGPGAVWASIPGATWIWSPMTPQPGSQPITGATSPADNQEFFFTRPFVICGNPTGGTISIAADNMAEVFLNGASTAVVTTCSETNPTTCGTSSDWAVVTTVNVPASSLAAGLNTITIHANNAPNECSPNTYACNPAGVILSATFTDALPAVPQCSNPTGSAGSTITVPTAQGCTDSEFCACFNVAGNVTTTWLDLGTSCPSTFTIAGTISGLTGSGLDLQDNGTNDLLVPAGSP